MLAPLLILSVLLSGSPGSTIDRTEGARADTTALIPLPADGGARRVDELRGVTPPTPGALIDQGRSYLPGEPHALVGGVSASLLSPELYSVWNSALPHSLNEGTLWAGRGLSTRVRAGVELTFRRLRLTLAPEFIREENRAFQTFSYPESTQDPEARERDPLASPFHYPPGSMDLPQRFGTETLTRFEWGESAIAVRISRIEAGAATGGLHWGPGIRNALLMSRNAPGIPRLFIRTAEPIRIGFGSLDAYWLVGRLEESEYFDRDSGNDYRSISALAFSFSPNAEPGLAVGAARAVYAPSEGGSLPIGATFDVFRNVGRPFAAPGDSLLAPAPDQLISFFARWLFPAVGFEVFGEWGRYEQPANLRDFLQLPQHSRGYTVGLQWARPIGDGEVLRIHAEATNLEPSTSYRVRPFGEWYASRAVPQGYTHRGRVIGAAIGPSGSAQWISLDWLGPERSLGWFAGRIRWENQAQQTYFPEFRRGDVSLYTGIRAGGHIGRLAIQGEYSATARLNYLFQSSPLDDGEERGVDLRNHTLKLLLSTVVP